ncbi:LuxR C-terminal-related transcriptional regulator [Bacillus cabrialesii subsp. cabrialesii]|uniref:LuxR C-terminal-related transcriptional regulator n=1 Tax=Bacillus cabrialesii TaxID=2487276 RepID=UPI0033062964
MDIRHRIIKLEQVFVSFPTYIQAVIAEIQTSIPFAASCCTAVDPDTLLSIGAITDGQIENIHPQLFESEYGQLDYNQYTTLLHTKQTAAILSEATGGDLRKSKRSTDILQPAGFGDELRAVLLDQEECWGHLSLFRGIKEPHFQKEERRLLAELAPLIGQALRRFRLTLSLTTSGQTSDPGILILSHALDIISFNQPARHWLTVLREWENINEDILPKPIRAVSTKARTNETAKVLITNPGLSLKASRLTGNTEQIAVSFEPASPAETLMILTDAFNLTKREKDITSCVIRGLSTKEMAGELHISAYTVQDHLKSIFTKTGAGSRRELARMLIPAAFPGCE